MKIYYKLILFLIAVFFFFSLTWVSAATLSNVVSNCTGEDISPISNNFTTVCQDPNGSRLSSNDGIVEIHNATKDTGNKMYGGVKIQSVNTSITNCISVTQVYLCYEWWYSGVRLIASPKVEVSNDTGTTFINVNSSDPPSVANPVVTCQNVTANRTWTCGNFFGASGTRASAAVEVAENTNPAPQNVTVDVLFFNVTYSDVDIIAPTIALGREKVVGKREETAKGREKVVGKREKVVKIREEK